MVEGIRSERRAGVGREGERQAKWGVLNLGLDMLGENH